jgi:hypothetical protein
MYQFHDVPSLQVFQFNINYVTKSFEFELVTWILIYLERHKENSGGMMKQYYKVLGIKILATITAFLVVGRHNLLDIYPRVCQGTEEIW